MEETQVHVCAHMFIHVPKTKEWRDQGNLDDNGQPPRMGLYMTYLEQSMTVPGS